VHSGVLCVARFPLLALVGPGGGQTANGPAVPGQAVRYETLPE
jgi:hypothetical protein